MYGGVAMVYPDTPLGVSVMSGRTVGGTRVFDRYDKHSNRTFPTTDVEGRNINAPIDPRWVGKTDDEAMPPRDAAAQKVVMISVTALVWVSFEPEAVSSPTVTSQCFRLISGAWSSITLATWKMHSKLCE